MRFTRFNAPWLVLIACTTALDGNAVVLAFGDSLAYGTGASAPESYPVVLERLIGRKVVAAGVPKLGLTGSPAGFYAEIAKEFRIPYDGEVLKNVLTDNVLKSDWVHSNAKGYARIAQSLADLFKPAEAI